MLPFILILTLTSGALAAYLPFSERRLRDLGVGFALVTSGLAVYLAWPGFTGEAQIFGPGGLWHLDGLTSLMFMMIAAMSLSSAVVAHRYLAHEHHHRIVSIQDLRHYYAMVPVFIASMYVAVLSNHVGLLWIALEATTLSTTLLVAFYRKQSALEAAWKYILLCSLGIGLGLVGMLLLAAAAGQQGSASSLLLSDFRALAAAGSMNLELLKWAFVFVFIGLGTKLGLVPLHAWLPDAHSKTPAPVSALLSGILLNVALVSLLRFRQVTDLALADGGVWTGKFFLIFGCLSVVISALVMIVQRNYKRLLAYSSIEHMGLIAFAIGLGPAGLIPALMHVPGHALLKSTLFLGIGEIVNTHGTPESGPGIWHRLPKTASLFLVSLLFLLAVPPGAMFVSQRLMIGLGLQNFLWPSLVVLVAMTVVFVTMLYHVYGLIFGTEPVTSSGPVTPEPVNVTHVVMLVQLLLAVGLGIMYLTPQGLNLMVRIAESLSVSAL